MIGNERGLVTRIWEPGAGRWRETSFPTPLVRADAAGRRHETAAQLAFDLQHPDQIQERGCHLRDDHKQIVAAVALCEKSEPDPHSSKDALAIGLGLYIAVHVAPSKVLTVPKRP